MKLKVVFDTNILISAIIFGGNPKLCLELARDHKIEMITSKILLLELAQKLHGKFQLPEDTVKNIIKGLSLFATIVEPQTPITVITQDPSDNIILETALEAQADFIISGDKKHLLSLKKIENIPIISAADFLKSL